ncbi:Phospholipid transfer protein C2CD2L [Takifugu flavidus]|uniref:Phospholipid transfer protein C2CD2L n=1 Tax=Takifugu flavidus TaxID=433684 RepID=A0A5C6P4W0_9TELE|nr:Phospholipid transfer protein C2CD2L [Takifugu flavidus]
MELQELGWLCLVSLFLVSLLIVLGWLCQYCMTLLHLQGSRSRTKQVGGDSPWPQLSVTVPKRSLAGTVGSFLQKLCLWRGRRPPSEAGVKGLLSSLFSYKSVREQCQRTWVKALNEQACRHGVREMEVWEVECLIGKSTGRQRFVYAALRISQPNHSTNTHTS